MKKSDLTPEFIRSCIALDGDWFVWKPRYDDLFKRECDRARFNNNFAGRRITRKRMPNGYDGIRIHGHFILAHRLVWVLHHGRWPERDIDHINGDISDNRIENLRDVTRSINMRNTRRRRNNTSGMSGVFYDRSIKKWCARVHLGSFETKEEAVRARQQANGLFGFTHRHGVSA